MTHPTRPLHVTAPLGPDGDRAGTLDATAPLDGWLEQLEESGVPTLPPPPFAAAPAGIAQPVSTTTARASLGGSAIEAHLAAPGLLDGLNPPQREAVLSTEGPLLVLAGAGSGKTRVLITRIAHLVRNLGVDPSQVLAITFTRKAAHEMRERLAASLEPDEAALVTLSTFHALGVLMLRESTVVAGLPDRFTIADEYDALTRVRAVLQRQGVARNADGESARDVLARIEKAKAAFADLVARDVRTAEAAGEPMSADLVTRYRQGDPSIWERALDALDAPNLERFQAQYAAYQDALHADGLVDYSDLIALPTLLLLQRPEMRRFYSMRWRYLLVDEYQDTDYVQDHLLRLLAGTDQNLCVVGDDDQSIYSWRGARVENIRTFPARYQPCQVVALEQNYRSTPTILDTANAALLTRREPGSFPKHLWTDRPAGEPVRLWTCDSQEAEAYAITADIERAMQQGAIASYDDVLVLYRINSLARPLEEAFRRSSIPHRLVAGLGLLERRVVRDTLAYLRAAVNWRDLGSFERAVGTPSRGVGPAAIEALRTRARVLDLTPVETALQARNDSAFKKRVGEALASFATLLLQIRSLGATHGAAAAVQHTLHVSGVRQGLVDALAAAELEDDEEESVAIREQIQQIDDFTLYVEEFSRLERHQTPGRDAASLDALLDHLTTLGLTDGASNAEDTLAATLGSVTLMSVHASKGLEYRRVYVVGLEEKVFPVTAMSDDMLSTETADPAMAEEARLFYVAVTRAMDSLVLSSSRTRELRGQEPQPMMRSRFLAGLPETLFRHELVR